MQRDLYCSELLGIRRGLRQIYIQGGSHLILLLLSHVSSFRVPTCHYHFLPSPATSKSFPHTGIDIRPAPRNYLESLQ